MKELYFVAYLYRKLRIFNNCYSCFFMKFGLGEFNCEFNK